MSIILLATTFFLSLLAAWAIFVPFFPAKENETKCAPLIPDYLSELRDLRQKADKLRSEIEDLKEDQFLGRMREDDYLHSRFDLSRQAQVCLDRISEIEKALEH